MHQSILKIEIKYEHDVVLARQRARQIAELLGFGTQDQVRIATSVSELARNAFQYAGGGKLEFLLVEEDKDLLQLVISDKGKGIAALQTVLDGNYHSKTGMGLGIIGARRLMDEFSIASSSESGTVITIGKYIPDTGLPLMKKRAADITRELSIGSPDNPFVEIQQQNQELLAMLEEVHRQQKELAQLNQELEETNRGVVALYAELDERADYLSRASDLKTQFLSNMTHEFRTPLNSILSISQILLGKFDGELTAEQEKQVKYIQAGAQSLSELVNDLLDLAKVEAGKVIIRPVHFEVSAMFGMLRGMLKPLLEHNSSISLVLEEPVGIPPLYTDEGKLSQILRNFLSNGIKYTQRGEVRVTAQMKDSHHVTFYISDTGIGIAQEDLKRIFEEFTQLEGNHQMKVKGTGLGLPLSRKLAQLLGGTVSVESTLGLGSVFSVTIPIHYSGPMEAVVFPSAQSEAINTGHIQRIMIIDDSESDRYVLKKLLADVNATILEAGSGVEGVYMARQALPDLIFLDLNMPDLSGFDVLDLLEKDPSTSTIPVIVHSSESMDESERKRLETRTLALFSKDYSRQPDILNEIRVLLSDTDSPSHYSKGKQHG